MHYRLPPISNIYIESRTMLEDIDPMNIIIVLEEYVPTVDTLWLAIHKLSREQLRILTAHYQGVDTTAISNTEHMPVQKVIRIINHTKSKLKPFMKTFGKELAEYGYKR